MNPKIKRMETLIKQLNAASKSYYQTSISLISDYEYDQLYDELLALEEETGQILPNSPTIQVEPTGTGTLAKVEHVQPMLSLAKTKSISELEAFLGSQVGLLSWKLDGVTIVLTYDDGRFQQGVTRGNGIIGEIITSNVRTFKNIPLTIPYQGNLVLRGEAVIKYSDFAKMNDELDEEAEKFKNPRNLCSGSVRQIDSRVTAKRNVYCLIFALITNPDHRFKTKEEEFVWLREMGFDVVDFIKVTQTNLRQEVLNFQIQIEHFDIPSDGLVLTFNELKYAQELGNTAKYPRDSLAFKWQDKLVETELLAIDWNVSRTGLINPVAVFKPVTIEKTVVTRASVHNVSILKKLKLGLKDHILVYKANMIIPQIAQNLTNSNQIKIPTICPQCGQATKIKNENGIEYLYCENDLCPAKLLKRFSLFVSRDGMNITGLSEATLHKLMSERLISEYADLYKLEKHRNQIASFEGFGVKSTTNLIEAINNSRTVKLSNLIYALGIPEIGLARAKLICHKFNDNYQKIITATWDALSEINGIGPVIATEWVSYFKKEINQKVLANLIPELKFENPSYNQKILANQKFVITGALNHFVNRNSLVELIESNGGTVVTSVSSKVDFLINNDFSSKSTKNQMAKKLGVKIISEAEFLNKIKEK